MHAQNKRLKGKGVGSADADRRADGLLRPNGRSDAIQLELTFLDVGSTLEPDDELSVRTEDRGARLRDIGHFRRSRLEGHQDFPFQDRGFRAGPTEAHEKRLSLEIREQLHRDASDPDHAQDHDGDEDHAHRNRAANGDFGYVQANGFREEGREGRIMVKLQSRVCRSRRAPQGSANQPADLARCRMIPHGFVA